MEAFNEAMQKWIPVDALVTHTVSKPWKFEPPSSDERNSMSYVIALEGDGVAKDVTRRYARAYNAKTRKMRVESVGGGEKWWRRTLKVFKRPHTSVRSPELGIVLAIDRLYRIVIRWKTQSWRVKRLQNRCHATTRTLKIIPTTH